MTNTAHDHALASLTAAKGFLRSLATQIRGHEIEIAHLRQREAQAKARYADRVLMFVEGGLVTQNEVEGYAEPIIPTIVARRNDVGEFTCPYCRGEFMYRYAFREHMPCRKDPRRI